MLSLTTRYKLSPQTWEILQRSNLRVNDKELWTPGPHGPIQLYVAKSGKEMTAFIQGYVSAAFVLWRNS